VYCDTDWITYIQKVGETSNVETEYFLGDLTSEMGDFDSGSFIEEFVSGGTKNYALAVFCHSSGNPISKCKVNYKNSKILNFTALISMILEYNMPLHVHNAKKIKKKHGGVVMTEPETNELKVV